MEVDEEEEEDKDEGNKYRGGTSDATTLSSLIVQSFMRLDGRMDRQMDTTSYRNA